MSFFLQCKCPEAAFHRCSSEKVFNKNAANLLKITDKVA